MGDWGFLGRRGQAGRRQTIQSMHRLAWKHYLKRRSEPIFGLVLQTQFGFKCRRFSAGLRGGSFALLEEGMRTILWCILSLVEMISLPLWAIEFWSQLLSGRGAPKFGAGRWAARPQVRGRVTQDLGQSLIHCFLLGMLHFGILGQRLESLVSMGNATFSEMPQNLGRRGLQQFSKFGAGGLGLCSKIWGKGLGTWRFGAGEAPWLWLAPKYGLKFYSRGEA